MHSAQRIWFTKFLRNRVRRNAGNAAQQRRHEATIQALQAEIELLTTYSSDVVYRLRYSTMQYDYISPSVERLLGFTAEELKRLNLRDLIVETRIVSDGLRPVTSYQALEAKRHRGEVTKWQADYRMRTKSGEEIWVMDISYPWQDERGAIIGSIGSLRDITDRVYAEEALIESQAARYQSTPPAPAEANSLPISETKLDENTPG